MLDPAIWWYVTRASAIIAWALMVISVTWGILLATRVMKPKDNPGWLLDLHRWLAGLAVVFTGIHMASLYIDEYAAFTFQDLFIPFHSQYQKIAWLGDGNNIVYSLIEAAAKFNFELSIACPKKFRPDEKIVKWAKKNNAKILSRTISEEISKPSTRY